MAKDLARLMEQAGRHISDYQTKDEASALMDEIDKFRWDNALIVGNF